MYSGLQTFEVDFNDVDDDRLLVFWRDVALTGRVFDRLSRRSPIRLWDEESGSCLGIVNRVRGKRVEVYVDWESWEPVAMVDVAYESVPAYVPSFAPLPSLGTGQRQDTHWAFAP